MRSPAEISIFVVVAIAMGGGFSGQRAELPPSLPVTAPPEAFERQSFSYVGDASSVDEINVGYLWIAIREISDESTIEALHEISIKSARRI